MNFVRSETRRHNRYVESVQSELIAGLSEPVVQQELGETGPELLTLAEGIFIPNICNGVVSLPEEYTEKEGTAVIALREGDGILRDISMLTLSPTQRKNLAHRATEFDYLDTPGYSEANLVQSIDHGLQTLHSPDTISLSELGEVTHKEIHFRGIDEKPHPFSLSNYLFAGRPLVTLKCVKGGLSSEILSHELHHIKQRENNPTYPNDKEAIVDMAWREELEAYNLSAQYAEKILDLDAVRYLGKTGLGVSMPIESFRAKYNNSSDPFFPHPALKKRYPHLVKYKKHPPRD